MDMRDKEFDRLFNSKLGDLEVEPSPMVWDNIADGLQERKRKFSPYLSIAASLIILASAGLLFFREAENNVIKPVKQNEVAVEVSKSVAPANLAKNDVVQVHKKVSAVPPEIKSAKRYIVAVVPKVIVDKKPSQKNITEDSVPVLIDPAPVQPELTLVATEPTQNKPAMLVPGKETSFITATDNQETIEKAPTTAEAINTPAKKRGIHSLGGLIGAIVAKIDKREDKLIEFTEGEENTSTITGLNLGLVKIKKK